MSPCRLHGDIGANVRTAFITIFGLNTPADSDCYGLRALMQSFAGAGDIAAFFAYDDPQLLASVKAAVAGFDRVVLCGHSHGGAAVKWVLDHWAAEGAVLRADLAIFLDPAPEACHFGQFFSWQAADANLLDRWHVPLSVCARAVCIYQRNEMIIPGVIGVCGVPFVPVPVVADTLVSPGREASFDPSVASVQNINVTAWGVFHCHMLSDERVQGLVKVAVGGVAWAPSAGAADSVTNGVAGCSPNSTRSEREQLYWLQIFLASLNRRIDQMATKKDLATAVQALKDGDTANKATISDLRSQLAAAVAAADTVDDAVVADINGVTADLTPPAPVAPVAPAP